ncbi:hypothetical protein [Hymenobacter jeollabukensis]|uniref:Uncharacterized protein n=1 Tax=Hymenobacter jeollabukensis TaxID=2025313 RepID=A0A5R8WKT5_9BACT|nr:hypothetical protein [Hymenobacter jeollabukensis]TLM89183.1 hypothetical protein FDY95_21680 [Hymenobacter jeollabukensis]
MSSTGSAVIEHTLGQLLYRDHWTPTPVAPLSATFRALGMSELDLHLLLFELQMSHGAVYPIECLGLDDALHCLVVLTVILLPVATAQPPDQPCP